MQAKIKIILEKLIRARAIITIVIFLGLLFWSSYSVYVLNKTSIYVENGFLENIQVFTISIACFVLFLPVVYQNRTDKLILLFLSFLCLSFALREVDVEDLNIPSVLKFIGSGIGRNALIAAGFITMFSYLIFNIKHYKNLLRSFLVSKEGALIITAGILLCIGEGFENMSSVPHHVLFEELSELSGYVLFLLGAFTYSKNGTTRPASGYSKSVDSFACAKSTPLLHTTELRPYASPNSSSNTHRNG